MNLPNVVSELVKAQNHYDSAAYADCFSEKAVVVDEGNTYKGRTEIKEWIEGANEKFKVIMKPIAYTETEAIYILTAEVSGSFDGSPVLLDYHFEIASDKIDSLEITVNATQ
jgi:hypothetical protein